MSVKQHWLVIGAGGGIARAIIERALASTQVRLIAVSRRQCPDEFHDENALEWHVCDYSEDAVQALIMDWCERGLHLDRVIITNGLLHGGGLQPEKKLEDLDSENLHAVYEACALVPMRWVSRLIPVLKGSLVPQLVVFSARVGSIGDNRLGGLVCLSGGESRPQHADENGQY